MHHRLKSLMAAVPSALQGDCWKVDPALELEIVLFESIIHRLGNPLQLFIFEFHTLKNFHTKFVVYKNLFLFNDFISNKKKCEPLLPNVMYCTFTWLL